jgi:hypothetical protein
VSSVALTRNFVRIPDIVTKEPPPSATPGVDVGTTIKDIFAIAMSAATVIYLAHQVK